MLIDFHTHIFPDEIAERVLKTLSGNIYSQTGIKQLPCTDGTVCGLRKSMRENKVNISVVLPIATKPSQTASINNYAEKIMSDDVISFGSLHPLQDDWEYVLSDLAERGFKGIKLHPQYQQVQVDSKEVIKVLKKAEELKMYTVLHSGVDYGMPPPIMCTPAMLKNVLDEVSGNYIIAAHMGSLGMWDDVEKYLVGTPIRFDTAAISSFINKGQYRRIIINHGADKVLFSSDSPWEDLNDTISGLKALGLPDKDFEMITYKNALNILGINNTTEQ